MRLVNPGTGEVCDRLSILALKVLFGRAAGKDVDHFEKEQAVLQTKINGTTLKLGQALELAAVNAALWHAEDDLRALRGQDLSGGTGVALRVVVLAFRIQELNDQRAALVEAINKETGTHLGSEKHGEELG